MTKTNLKNDHILSFKTQVKQDAKFACVGVLKYAPIKRKKNKKKTGKKLPRKNPHRKNAPQKNTPCQKVEN